MNITPKFDWPPEAVARLRQLADGTRSATEIAATLGVGRNAVIGKIHRLTKIGKADGIKLTTSTAARRRKPKDGQKAKKPKHGPIAVSWANGKRLAPKKGMPTEPVFLSAEVETPDVTPEISPIPLDHALVLPPMTFGEAIERNRCLYFAGDPYSPAGPEMPVCGAERPEWVGDRSRYCVRHRLLQYTPRDRGGERNRRAAA